RKGLPSIKAVGRFGPRIGDGALARLSFFSFGFAWVVLALACFGAQAQPPVDGGAPPTGPVYQWHPVDGQRHEDDRHDNRRDDRRDRRDFRKDFRRRSPSIATPQVSSGWFERPYPYHLDFFRMRFGSRVGALGEPYGPGLPAYYGPYYTSPAVASDPYGGANGNGPGIGYSADPNMNWNAVEIPSGASTTELPAPAPKAP